MIRCSEPNMPSIELYSELFVPNIPCFGISGSPSYTVGQAVRGLLKFCYCFKTWELSHTLTLSHSHTALYSENFVKRETEEKRGHEKCGSAFRYYHEHECKSPEGVRRWVWEHLSTWHIRKENENENEDETNTPHTYLNHKRWKCGLSVPSTYG